MEHQFVEKGNKQLYTVYHEPTTFNNSDTGIVLCYPIGQEYIRCHKLFVSLSNLLSNQGFHVIRFDYLGTGDSSGEFSSVFINGCLSDIHAVIYELKNVCAVSKIILIGIRFGATLSLLYSQFNKIDKLVLWHPVTNGAEYLKSIVKNYNKWLDGSFTKEKRNGNKGTTSFGFTFSPHFTDEIKSISFSKSDFDINVPILLIDSKERSEMEEVAGISFLEEINKEFWIKREDEMEKSMVPTYEINKISNWVTKSDTL